jgi:drug/metabolite transporter (DMT)-like permease
LRSFILIVFSVTIAILGQLILKRGISQVTTGGSLLAEYIRMFTTPAILAGFVFFVTSALIWMKALQKIPISKAYPMVSLGYVLVLLASKTGFIVAQEEVPLIRWIGVIMICAGVILVGLSPGK